MTPFLAGTVVLAGCALCAAWLDVTSRRLPNWLSASTAISGILFLYLTSGIGAVPWAAAHAMIALVVGGILFRFGLVGGGDGKFYAACAAWMPIQQGFELLFAVSLAGLILVAFWFSVMRARRALDESRKGKFGQVPFGLAIAVGVVATRVMYE
ncbi:A24 family peptidase [Tsuneonella sp. SYSU-LHT278]|uniref:A24 family peptidase n=1 Tax=Tsuneonella sediminis TaxID=3416089 RepID=UPI003F78B127